MNGLPRYGQQLVLHKKALANVPMRGLRTRRLQAGHAFPPFATVILPFTTPTAREQWARGVHFRQAPEQSRSTRKVRVAD